MAHLAHLIDRKAIARANMAVVLGVVWGGLAVCAIGAAGYDFRHWLAPW